MILLSQQIFCEGGTQLPKIDGEFIEMKTNIVAGLVNGRVNQILNIKDLNKEEFYGKIC